MMARYLWFLPNLFIFTAASLVDVRMGVLALGVTLVTILATAIVLKEEYLAEVEDNERWLETYESDLDTYDELTAKLSMTSVRSISHQKLLSQLTEHRAFSRRRSGIEEAAA